MAVDLSSSDALFEAAARRSSRGAIRALVGESASDERVALASSLRDAGFDVGEADSAAALRALLREGDAAVLLLGELSGSSRAALLREVRERAPQLRVVVSARFDSARAYQEVLEAGAVRALCRPHGAEELVLAARYAAECGGSYRGHVHGLGLLDLLQLLHFARRSVTVALEGVPADGTTTRGAIHLDAGELAHAALEGEEPREGAEALRVLLGAPQGFLRTEPLRSTPRTLRGTFEGLLLDALRVLDEEASGERLSAGDSVFPLGAPRLESVLPPPAPLPRRSASTPPARRSALPPALPKPGASSAAPAFCAALERIGPELQAFELLPHESAAVLLRGEELDAELLEELLAFLQRLAGWSPDWTRVEWSFKSAAIALFRAPMSGEILAVTSALNGRYALVNFRSQVCRLSVALGM